MTNYREIAQETLAIIDANGYKIGDTTVKLSEDPKGPRDVIVCTPEKVQMAVRELNESQGTNECEIRVDMLDSLTSAQKNGVGKMLVLNFANAFRPGGGFLRGARAQEEAMCRCSTLYASISGEAALEMYEYNKAHMTPEGSDYMLLSPSVIVFRDVECNLLKTPYAVSVLTAAAPNLYGEAEGLKGDALLDLMRHKIKNVVAVAAKYSYETLILGAWGCGAFGHDAKQVAQCFYDVLVGEGHKKLFKKIVFSILTNYEFNYNYARFFDRFSKTGEGGK